jgi:hypothetical protein
MRALGLASRDCVPALRVHINQQEISQMTIHVNGRLSAVIAATIGVGAAAFFGGQAMRMSDDARADERNNAVQTAVSKVRQDDAIKLANEMQDAKSHERDAVRKARIKAKRATRKTERKRADRVSTQARSEGYSSGTSAGFSAGHSAGASEGYSDGYGDGSLDGYVDGLYDGDY